MAEEDLHGAQYRGVDASPGRDLPLIDEGSLPLTTYEVFHVTTRRKPYNRHAIFVQFSLDGSGRRFYVAGDLEKGMVYNHESATMWEYFDLVSKERVGTVKKEVFEKVEEVLGRVEVPKRQSEMLNTYLPDEEAEKEIKDWVVRGIAALKKEGVLEVEK